MVGCCCDATQLYPKITAVAATRPPSPDSWRSLRRAGQRRPTPLPGTRPALSDTTVVPAATNPTIALQIDRTILNLSYFTAEGLALGISTPNAETKSEEIDVAIAPLDGSYWGLLTNHKNKLAIDLDAWREPSWTSVKYCLAAGYPDEHKQKTGEKIANQFVVVVAEIASRLARTERLIALSSTLDQPHGYYFSGMSGGPVYAAEGHEQREVQDEELFPIGIIFEGFPSSGRADMQGSRDFASAFLTDRDLFFRALMLTPENFDEWLQKAGIHSSVG